MKTISGIVLASIVLFCSAGLILADDDPHFSGTISDLDRGEPETGSWHIQLEGEPGLHIMVKQKTEIVSAGDPEKTWKPSELREGSVVRVWHTGFVMGTDRRMATAKRIVVVKIAEKRVRPEDGQWDIIGHVESLQDGDGNQGPPFTLVVKGSGHKDSKYEQARVTVGNGVSVVRLDESRLVDAGPEDLAEGQLIRVWCDGLDVAARPARLFAVRIEILPDEVPELDDVAGEGTWDIIGMVNSIRDNGDDGEPPFGLSIEGGEREGSVYRRASVTVNTSTEVFRVVDGKPEKAAASDISEGQMVRVRSDGQVRESFLVQMDAVRVEILPEPDEENPADDPEGPEPNYIGKIEKLNDASFLMSSASGRVVIRVNDTCELAEQIPPGEVAPAEFSDLEAGDSVEVYTTGMIMKSMPPQAVATRIVIINE